MRQCSQGSKEKMVGTDPTRLMANWTWFIQLAIGRVGYGASNSLNGELDVMTLDAIEQVKGVYVVTADHGNAEDTVKRDKAGKPSLDKEGKLQILASHTLKPVNHSYDFDITMT
ncbi:Metalloenzyme protein [Raphanus sativus]|nr:Metalloenzyme protein [Raphanus sativus]